MKSSWSTAAALVLGIGFAASAEAAPVIYCSAGGIDLIGQGCISGGKGYAGGGDGYYGNSGGGDAEDRVEQSILLATGVAVDLQLYGKSDANGNLFSFATGNINGSMSGSWDVLADNVLIKYITVKAANGYALYELPSIGANSGTFSTLGMLTPNGKNQPGVSHISFWLAPSVGGVPEPGTWAMMLIGFGAVGYSLRAGGSRRLQQAI